MIHPIRYYGDPVLRRRATEVTEFGPELKALAADMLETMYAADGVGLAAPQIGVPLRLFVALEMQPGADADPEDDGDITADERRRRWDERREHVIVNPVIVARSGLQYGRDGCLSLPGLSVLDVPRDLTIDLEYQNLAGERRSLSATGYFAHVLQHEFDHLQGVLFFDHLPEGRRRAFLEEHRAALADMQREAKAFLKLEREKSQRQPAQVRGR
ncbi:MAG: peptide deformylase [Trueperaceae bacterium]